MLSSAPTRDKISPSFVKNDNDLDSHLLDVTTDGTRPCLMIFVAEMQLKKQLKFHLEGLIKVQMMQLHHHHHLYNNKFLEVDEERMVKCNNPTNHFELWHLVRRLSP